jgi:methyl-accepting chemotaxis protein
MRNDAKERIEQGKEFDVPSLADNDKMVSLAELSILIKSLHSKIQSAIPLLRFVSYKKGVTKKPEHLEVDNIVTKLTDVFNNILILAQYTQKFKEGMYLQFVAFHPLSGFPMTVDSLVRLGFVTDVPEKEKPNIRQVRKSRENGRGRGRSGFRGRGAENYAPTWGEDSDNEGSIIENTYNDSYSLMKCLEKLSNHISKVDFDIERSKKDHEKQILDSINQKQDSRTKSSAVLKQGELEDIAKSIRSQDTKTWTIADNIDKTSKKLTKLIENVNEMQSSTRKSANATIKLVVPAECEMEWAVQLNVLDNW